MAKIGWLHLSDFHEGQDRHGALWPHIKALFFDDLKKLHKRCGPWKILFFTGDLTSEGTDAQFSAFSDRLNELREYLRTIGSDPVVLAVPGNHDLTRPDPSLSAVRLLCQNPRDDIAYRMLWTKGTEYRKTIEDAFSRYSAWARKWNSEVGEFRDGQLPGDFSATLKCDGLRIGVLGLNSAFLQLGAGDFKGRLAVDAEQFQGCCGGDGPDWCKQHEACFLLTHHPPEWLSSESQRVLSSDIAGPGRFIAHLFGHAHAVKADSTGSYGEELRNEWQVNSLCGLPYFGEPSDRGARQHGFTVGQIKVKGRQVVARLWPRRAAVRDGRICEFVPDERVSLQDDGGTRERVVAKLESHPPKLQKKIPRSHLLIPTETPFNALCHNKLLESQGDLGIVQDFYATNEVTPQNYVTAWERFLNDPSVRWLLVNHPEQTFARATIANYVERMARTDKHAIFFESGQEFLHAGDELVRKRPELRNPATIIQTDSEDAIGEMIRRAAGDTQLGHRNLPLFILLIPGPNHPTALERQTCYLKYASKLAEATVASQLVGSVGQEPGFEHLGFIQASSVSMFPVQLSNWTRKCAREAVQASLPHIRGHCHRANYLLMCGNDDIALGAYDTICSHKERSCGECSDLKPRTVFLGFDGLDEMLDLVDKGKAITACADLNFMASWARELVLMNGASRPPDGRMKVTAKVLAR